MLGLTGFVTAVFSLSESESEPDTDDETRPGLSSGGSTMTTGTRQSLVEVGLRFLVIFNLSFSSDLAEGGGGGGGGGMGVGGAGVLSEVAAEGAAVLGEEDAGAVLALAGLAETIGVMKIFFPKISFHAYSPLKPYNLLDQDSQ